MCSHVSELWIYPIKGAHGISVKDAEVDQRGFKYDRTLAVVDEEYDWITSRSKERFQLAQIQSEIHDGILTIVGPGMQSLNINLRSDQLSVFHDIHIKGQPVTVGEEPEGSEWFKEYFHKDVHLVHMTPGSKRTTDTAFSAEQTETALTDNFPFLVTSQADLDALNQRISERGGEPVTMQRFRPNIVIVEARADYIHCMSTWQAGDIRMRRARPCDRCVATLIHEDGTRSTKEPLATLNTYHRASWQVNGKEQNPTIFGEYVVNVDKQGSIEVGNKIIVQDEAGDGWDRPISLDR